MASPFDVDDVDVGDDVDDVDVDVDVDGDGDLLFNSRVARKIEMRG